MIFRKLPVEPDPDTPIDELIKPIMPTLPVEPMTDQDILEGYAKFKEQNPGIGMGPGLQVMIYGRLPDGTPLTFSNSAQAAAFNQYLESIGQPPFDRDWETWSHSNSWVLFFKFCITFKYVLIRHRFYR